MILRIFVILTFIMQSSCSVNVLEAFGDKETDQAKYIEAKKLIDKSQYDEAIQVLLGASAKFQEKREVRTLMASAYAGRGGLEFLSIVEAFKDASSVNLFPFLMNGFRGGSSDRYSDLSLAEGVIDLISEDPAERTEDENILMVLIYLAKMGNMLSYYMDTDGDGTLDPTFVNACTDSDNPGTAINDLNVGEVGMHLLKFVQTVTYLSNNFTSTVLADLDCQADLEGLEPFPGFFPLAGVCSIDDPAGYTNVHIAGFRSLIKESDFLGLGVSCSGDVTTCYCTP